MPKNIGIIFISDIKRIVLICFSNLEVKMFRVVFVAVLISIASVSGLEAKSCKDVDAKFRKMITEMKSKWNREDKVEEEKLAKIERELQDFQKKMPDDLRNKNGAIEKSRQQELANLKKAYDNKIKNLQTRKERAAKTNVKKIENLEKKIKTLKEKLKGFAKEKNDLEKTRQQLEDELAKQQQKKSAVDEAKKMTMEDEERKFLRTIEADYQKRFDELNADLAKWDEKETKEKEKVGVFDGQIEKFALEMANKLGEVQTGIDKKRDENAKKFKDQELEKKNMELDMELATKSQQMNDELKKYRKKKLAEKKKAQQEFKKFLKKKAQFKKRTEKLVKLAQKQRDVKIKAKKKEKQAFMKKCEKERDRNEAKHKKMIVLKYTNPLKRVGQKEQQTNDQIAKVNDQIALAQNQAFKVKEKTEREVQRAIEKAGEKFRNDKDKSNTKYDRRLNEFRVKVDKKKQSMEKKRARQISKIDKKKQQRQKILDRKKVQYEKEKSRCK